MAPSALGQLPLVGEAFDPQTIPTESLDESNWNTVLKRLSSRFEYPDILAVSPYGHDPDHVLHLSSVDTQSQLIARTLTIMDSQIPDYATAPYLEIFNWDEIFARLRKLVISSNHTWKKQVFYVVVFRSMIPPTTNYADLGALDKAAHAEATKSGNFLKYWFGSPDAHGRNLATCLWCSKEDARLGGLGPAHREAAGAARHLYTEWKIERLALVIQDDVTEWSITPWVD